MFYIIIRFTHVFIRFPYVFICFYRFFPAEARVAIRFALLSRSPSRWSQGHFSANIFAQIAFLRRREQGEERGETREESTKKRDERRGPEERKEKKEGPEKPRGERLDERGEG